MESLQSSNTGFMSQITQLRVSIIAKMERKIV